MMKIGILGKSEIAERRFVPALNKVDEFEFVGFASRENGDYRQYYSMVEDPKIDALYIPLPPSLHFEWAKLALENNKHILVEKPFTTNLEQSRELIEIARSKNLAVHENYMFTFHKQLVYIQSLIEAGKIGDIRLYRIDFTFPFRDESDFRYSKELGGGALLDCGGYTLKLANILLGPTIKVVTSKLNNARGLDVDVYGNATLENDKGEVAQISFGMDNYYTCSLEVLGSTGRIYTNRIFSAPSDYEPEILIQNPNERIIKITSDDTFKNSIEYFRQCIRSDYEKRESYNAIIEQSKLLNCIV
jgi:predicted dehydrogenase